MLLGASRKTAVARWLRRLQADLQQAQNSSLSDLRVTTTKYRASAPHVRIVTVTEWEIDCVSSASVDSCIALETRARRRRPTTRRSASGAAAPPPPVATTAFDLRRYDLKSAQSRGDAVEAFLKAANQASRLQKRVSQSDFWRVADYPTRHTYYRWKGAKTTTPAKAAATFRSVLALSAADFLTRAENKRRAADI